jgi:hypothetical protein
LNEAKLRRKYITYFNIIQNDWKMSAKNLPIQKIF